MKVNVWITAYNHGKYISDSLNSVLNQKTDFDFDIILGEDWSTDNTREILWVKSSSKILKKSGYKVENIGKKIKYLPDITAYKFSSVYYYFRYRRFKEQSKNYFAKAKENFNNNKRFVIIKLLIPSYLLYPVSIFNRNKLSLIKNSILGNKNKNKNLKDKKIKKIMNIILPENLTYK